MKLLSEEPCAVDGSWKTNHSDYKLTKQRQHASNRLAVCDQNTTQRIGLWCRHWRGADKVRRCLLILKTIGFEVAEAGRGSKPGRPSKKTNNSQMKRYPGWQKKGKVEKLQKYFWTRHYITWWTREEKKRTRWLKCFFFYCVLLYFPQLHCISVHNRADIKLTRINFLNKIIY